ncbi:MAG TPA: RsmG family class I SAM-dependent methyltransferase [Ilumatobacter sp.]
MRAETIEALRESQRLGFLGARPVEQAAEHAAAFATALGPLPDGARLIDLGSGGGLPGLVLAELLPRCSITLVDRRQKRTDFLQRAVRRLGHDHVDVREADVAVVVHDVEAGVEPAFDVVTARSFGPPDTTLRLARRLTHAGGTIVISEPPTGERWDQGFLQELGLDAERIGPVRVFHVKP